jgi:serine/threonine protein kinase
MQTAAGLAAAHAQGLVHRDIKPANILLENSVERVRITDFGLARAMDEASQTQSGILAGTPQYMAPEQALGEAIDYRTDLFSLGSVLYAMCTGQSPFRAASTVAVLRRICDTKQRPVREVNADIPESVANVVDRLLSKRPGDRVGSAEEVARILAELLAHLQHPPRTGRLFRRRVVAAFIAAAALAVGTVAALMGPSVNEADRHSDSQSSHQPDSQPADANGRSAARANAGHIESPLANPSPARRDVDSFEGELRTLHDELSRLEQLHWQDDPGLRSGELRALNNSLDALEREIGGP